MTIPSIAADGGVADGGVVANGGVVADGDRDVVEELGIRENSAFYRLLTNIDGDWRLTGSDLAIAQKFFDVGGLIGFSHAYFDEGNRIKIIDGFLKDYEGSIIRVDRRHRSVQVKIVFQEKALTTWLGYEEVAVP